jgi:hypothetical protein
MSIAAGKRGRTLRKAVRDRTARSGMENLAFPIAEK